MDPKEARIQLATTFRALAFYGLNEGVDNHVTVRCKVMLGGRPRYVCSFFCKFNIKVVFFHSQCLKMDKSCSRCPT